MSMTRKHYQAFADMMAELKPQTVSEDYYDPATTGTYLENQMFYSIMQGMGSVFKEDNPRFDEERFAKWVGKASGEKSSE